MEQLNFKILDDQKCKDAYSTCEAAKTKSKD